jgi:hypothetical protein
MNPRANQWHWRANPFDDLKFTRLLGYEHPLADPVLELRRVPATRLG